ncbi:SprT family protein [Halobacillus sp. K22]|uniref:SprT family protein n=1 Tax=Halobacillus sp. K22 TaxID=3457431 RepID=UPI003FCCB092
MTLTNAQLQQWTQEISLAYFQKPYVDQVEFNSRLRTTGGRYIPSKRVIELNPKYLEELGLEEFEGIIKHELCHYHLHIEGKGYKHGDREFKELLKHTNSPRFCKALPSQKKKPELHYYMCTSCGEEYTRKRRVNTKRYGCGKCSGKLKKK